MSIFWSYCKRGSWLGICAFGGPRTKPYTTSSLLQGLFEVPSRSPYLKDFAFVSNLRTLKVKGWIRE